MTPPENRRVNTGNTKTELAHIPDESFAVRARNLCAQPVRASRSVASLSGEMNPTRRSDAKQHNKTIAAADVLSWQGMVVR
eukprot:6199706-Pleurochrysis_carterae.AAC.1